jgi:hypothetical protein
MQRMASERAAKFRQRLQALRLAFQRTREIDRKLVPLMAAFGVAAFVVTGERGGFWVFPLVALAQGAWYYRQVGQIGNWLNFQPEVAPAEPAAGAVPEVPPDYSPPLARGLGPPLSRE